jgi:8-oxo-dGTP pyrophosphatase MutT (NUDIX family)
MISMQTKIVLSYGIIPVRKTEGGLEMLVIHMYGSAGGTHWTFPKGRPEVGETPIESALRECKEEVGITPSEVWEDSPIVESYTFVHNDVQIEKTVTFFIGVVEDAAVIIQPEEIKEASWVPIAAVSEKLTHESAQSVYRQAYTLISARMDR